MTGLDRQHLKEIISKGESEGIEFKESLGELKEIIETIVAFANKNGGKILIGVRDDGNVIGVKIGKGTIENIRIVEQQNNYAINRVIFYYRENKNIANNCDKLDP